jgi:hypothetical protein
MSSVLRIAIFNLKFQVINIFMPFNNFFNQKKETLLTKRGTLNSLLMKNSLLYGIIILFLSACNQNEETQTEADHSDIILEIEYKGLDTLFLDKTTDFQSLGLLQLTKIDNEEYLSHFSRITRSIYIYSLHSGKLMNKVTLNSEGANQIIFPITPIYFIHSLDSIFIDTQLHNYYLINDRAQVLKSIGKRSKNFRNNDLSTSFESTIFFDGHQIHGSIRMPFYGTPKETIYARASLKFQEELEMVMSIKNEQFIENFKEVMAYREVEENEGNRLINMPRYFVHHADYLFATTPVSDSMYVFKNGQLLESFYAGVSGFDKATHIEYLNFTRTIRRPGEILYLHETKRNSYYFNTLIDPDGRFIYRVMIQGTNAVFNDAADKKIPEFNGATLLAIDLETKEIATFELPLDEIVIQTQVFASSKGVHFRVKDQGNEDYVLFRIFGIN